MLELAAEAEKAIAEAAATVRARRFLFMRDQIVSVCDDKLPRGKEVRQTLFHFPLGIQVPAFAGAFADQNPSENG
jgi:hypothetical protein